MRKNFKMFFGPDCRFLAARGGQSTSPSGLAVISVCASFALLGCTGNALEAPSTDSGLKQGGVGVGGESLADCRQVHPAAVPLQRLNRQQHLNTVQDLLPALDVNHLLGGGSVLPADESTLWFAANTKAYVSSYAVKNYMDAAEEIAAAAVQSPMKEQLLPCQPTGDQDSACAEQFISSFGRRALRHDLDDGEKEV